MLKKIVPIILSLLLIIALIPNQNTARAANIKGEIKLEQTVNAAFAQGNDNKVDWYSFTATQEGLVKFSLSAGRPVDLKLYSEDGSTYLAGKVGSRNAMTGLYDAEFTEPLLKGSFYISVQKDTSYSYANVSDEYSLSAEHVASKYGDDSEPNEDADTALLMRADNPIGGYLGGADGNGKRDNEDWYHFSVSKDAVVAFAFSSEINAFVSIYSGDTSKHIAGPVSNWNALAKTYETSISLNLTAGTYYARVRRDIGKGWYWLGFTDSGKTLSPPDGKTTGERMDASDPTNSVQPPSLSLNVINEEGKPNASVGIKLQWSAVPGAQFYRIYRGTSSGNTTTLIADRVNSTIYIDLDIRPGTIYYYKVIPVVNGTEQLGLASGEMSATTFENGPEQLPDKDGKLGPAKSYILMQIDNPMMDVNGTQVEVDPGRGTAPILRYDRTMLPIRAVVEAMSGSVGWDAASSKVTLTANGNTVEMWIGNMNYTVNGVAESMDIAPFVENDRTMLPLRFATGNLNCRVTWINETREILIVFNGEAKI